MTHLPYQRNHWEPDETIVAFASVCMASASASAFALHRFVLRHNGKSFLSPEIGLRGLRTFLSIWTLSVSVRVSSVPASAEGSLETLRGTSHEQVLHSLVVCNGIRVWRCWTSCQAQLPFPAKTSTSTRDNKRTMSILTG